MPRRSVRTEVKENLNFPNDQVQIVNTNDLANSINSVKAVKQQQEEVIPSASAISNADLIKQAIDAATAIQGEKLAVELKAKELEIEKTLQERDLAHQQELESYKATLEALTAKTSEQIESIQSELKQTNTKLKDAKIAEKRMAEVFKLHGNPNPVVQAKTPALNVLTSTTSDRMVGAFAEFEAIKQKSVAVLKRSSLGNAYMMNDFREADKFAAENRDSLIKDLEAFAKKNGLLQGLNPSPEIVKQASTQASDISGAFLDSLSSIIRTTHRARFVFWQFAQTEFNYLKGEGSNVLVPRVAYSAASSNPADWELSGSGSFVTLDNTLQQISSGTVPITLKEYGLGKPSTVNQPVSLPSFVLAYSMLDLMNLLERNLGQSYAYFEDLKIRSLYAGTSVKLYNNNSNVATAGSSVAVSTTANPSGVLSKEFLIQLYAYMLGRQVESFADGCYALVLHPTAAAQFLNSLAGLYRIASKDEIEGMTSILNPGVVQPVNGSRVPGYIGTYYNFHIFQSNAFSVGIAGTEGVQTETIGATSNVLTRTSYAFGNAAVGRGVGTPFEIRKNEVTNYNRINSFIWRSEEGFAALDVDPTGYSDSSTVPQQLRVFQIRTTDTLA